MAQKNENKKEVHMRLFSAFTGLASGFSGSFSNLFDTSPTFNIDGAPMAGDFDINGNPFGVTEVDAGVDPCISANEMSFDDGFLATTFDSDSSFAMTDDISSGFCSDDPFCSDSSFDNDSFSSSWDD